MSSNRRFRGYETERLVSEYLSQWWENATSGYRGSGKDVRGVPFDVEVKAVAKLNIRETLRQVKARTNRSGELGFACFRHNGQGEASVAEYSCVIQLGDLVQLLLKAGYGQFKADSVELVPMRCNLCGSWIIEGSDCNTCKAM